MANFIKTGINWCKNILYKKDNFSLVGENPTQGEFAPVYFKHMIETPKDSFNASSYPIYAHIFNNSNMGAIRHYDLIRFDNVILRLKMMSEPLLNDFFEENEVIEWLRIQRYFFEYAFFNDYIYIEWDAEEKKYNLYYKTGANEEDLTEDLKTKLKQPYNVKNWWINLITLEKVYFAEPEKDLVRFSWFGRPVDMFRRWFNFCYKYELKLDIFNSSCLLFHKRLILEKTGAHNAQLVNLEILEKDLMSKAPYLNRVEGQSMVGFIPVPIMSGMELDLYFTAITKWVDRELTELGRLVNLNPKLERKTVGENDLAIDRQVDYLRAVSDQLKLMSLEMEERGWPSLSFKFNTSKSVGVVEEPEQPAPTPGAPASPANPATPEKK